MGTRTAHLFVALGIAACGGSSGSAKSANDSQEGSLSAGKQCLEDAAADRNLKPGVPESIGVSHILVRHADLERPQGATRSREEACLRALEALRRLETGADWNETVAKYSDAPGATGGSLGSVERDDLDPDFAKAAFALDVDEVSYVVESKRGFHVILRTE